MAYYVTAQNTSIFGFFSKPRFWGTYVLHPGFSWFLSFPCFPWFPLIQPSTPLLVAFWVVFVIFVIPVVFLKSTELQNIGLAKPRFRNTRYFRFPKSIIFKYALMMPHLASIGPNLRRDYYRAPNDYIHMSIIWELIICYTGLGFLARVLLCGTFWERTNYTLLVWESSLSNRTHI